MLIDKIKKLIAVIEPGDKVNYVILVSYPDWLLMAEHLLCPEVLEIEGCSIIQSDNCTNNIPILMDKSWYQRNMADIKAWADKALEQVK